MTVAWNESVLIVRDLDVCCPGPDGRSRVVDSVSFELRRGEVLALVGESGSGASTLARALLGLMPDSATTAGEVIFEGTDLLTAPADQQQALRRTGFGLIVKEPMTALDASRRILDHFTRALRSHDPKLPRREAAGRAAATLRSLGIPPSRSRNYPRDFSAGMQQRIAIALVLVRQPRVIVADEPTAALDVLEQAQILRILAGIRRSYAPPAILLITDNLGIVAESCDQVAVMSAGRIVEQGPSAQILGEPRHPCTRELLSSTISLTTAALRPSPGSPPDPVADQQTGVPGPAPATGDPLISVRDLQVRSTVRTGVLSRLLRRSGGLPKAVDGVSFDLRRGEVLGLLGESGCGASTMGRALLGLAGASGGSISFRGREPTRMGEPEPGRLRRTVQLVSQDPDASLNPSMTIGASIAEALRLHGIPPQDRDGAVDRALERVGLSPPERFSGAYPAQLPGSQQQRAVIARAICWGPDLLVADEPVSRLDVSDRVRILRLLDELCRDLGLAVVHISRDPASARFLCDRVAIMYRGRVVEIGPAEQVFAAPRHPYTRALLAAVPDPGPAHQLPPPLPRAEVPDAARPPAGCSFHPRCPQAFSRCGWEARDLPGVLDQRWAAVDENTFTSEQALIGELQVEQSAPKRATIRAGHGSPANLLALLEQMRIDDPGEQFWTGVEAMRAGPKGVELDLAAPSDPPLVPVGDGTEVACHLYPPS